MQIKFIPFYFNSFLSSPDVRTMSTEEIGAYFLILINSVDQPSPGYIDTDEDGLRNIAKLTPKQWLAARRRVLKKFKRGRVGYFNEKMVSAIKEQLAQLEIQGQSDKLLQAQSAPLVDKSFNPEIHPLQHWVSSYFTYVRRIPHQLTFAECENLLVDCRFPLELVQEKLIKMESTKGIQEKYNYVYHPLKEWCLKELKK